MFESEFGKFGIEQIQIFRKFRMFRNPYFWPKKTLFCLKNSGLWPKLKSKLFLRVKKTDISEKFLNFDNQTIPKLAKTKSLENSVFRIALLFRFESLACFCRVFIFWRAKAATNQNQIYFSLFLFLRKVLLVYTSVTVSELCLTSFLWKLANITFWFIY